MIQQTYKCDGCGITKQQTNHWFCALNQGDEYTITQWNEHTCCLPDIEHYCGSGCLGKAVSLWAAPKNAAAVQPEVVPMVYPEPAKQLECGCWNVCSGEGYFPPPYKSHTQTTQCCSFSGTEDCKCYDIQKDY